MMIYQFDKQNIHTGEVRDIGPSEGCPRWWTRVPVPTLQAGQVASFNGVVWAVLDVRPPAPPPVVPRQVTRRQAKQALHLAGLLASVDTALNGIPNQKKKALMRIEWEDSLTFDRDRPQLIELATAIGLTSAELDQLFISAAQL